MNLAFATNNIKKSKELKEILMVFGFNVLDLNDLGVNAEIIESGSTFHENALIKARYLFEKTGDISLGEDSGLEVDVLQGMPGVFSARFAGEHGNDQANLNKLLLEMEGKENRAAGFKTVIALYDGLQAYFFEGEIKGNITTSPSGSGGFGYDPVFIPKGFTKTFAEFSPEEKNLVSHRANAVRKLVDYFRATKRP